MNRFAFLFFFFFFFFFTTNLVAGPRPATIELKDLGVPSLANKADFDNLSNLIRKDLYVVLDQISSDEEAIKKATGLKNIDRAQVDRFVKLLRLRVPTAQAQTIAPEGYSQPVIQSFLTAWLGEQMRLASLWKRVSSEIFTFNEAERTGFELPDRTFELTFDDGPSAKDGETDKLMPVLEKLKIPSTFFVLGEKLGWRQERNKDVTALYKGHCLASHGFVHKSHQKMENPQESITRTASLLGKYFKQARFDFRPPYGQRTEDFYQFTRKNNADIVLWNIDSQDWHSKVTAEAMTGRVAVLMLLYRKGTLLYHDIHPKAAKSLPGLAAFFAESISWKPCS